LGIPCFTAIEVKNSVYAKLDEIGSDYVQAFGVHVDVYNYCCKNCHTLEEYLINSIDKGLHQLHNISMNLKNDTKTNEFRFMGMGLNVFKLHLLQTSPSTIALHRARTHSYTLSWVLKDQLQIL